MSRPIGARSTEPKDSCESTIKAELDDGAGWEGTHWWWAKAPLRKPSASASTVEVDDDWKHDGISERMQVGMVWYGMVAYGMVAYGMV
jgi:hypothetical protein